ncbi:IL22 protein, partial [Drymodes brunneopygia]|nr:IL22 protein [Drymodes brunneopygia]
FLFSSQASASDKDTDNRLIGQQLFVNIRENNRCYLMKRVVELVVKDVLLTEVKNQYPFVEEVAQFLASLTSELSSCQFSGKREHIEKNLEQMKNKMEQV